MKVSVIGGGISGLTAAYYLSKLPKVTSITVYEASQRQFFTSLPDQVSFYIVLIIFDFFVNAFVFPKSISCEFLRHSSFFISL